MSRTFLLLLFSFVTLVVPAHLMADPGGVETLAGETMGTHYKIRLVLPDGQSQSVISAKVQGVLDRVNSRMSTYREDSELSEFNRSSSIDWFPVSDETARVVGKALEIAELSGGKFDPTVGRLVRLWHFGPGAPSHDPPSDIDIQQALESVGYRLISVRLDPPALKKENPAAELDLSAIAKGYGVDAVSLALQELGISSSMVEIGGEVRTMGRKPDGSAWRIAIERPDESGQSIEKVLELTETSIATSGDYRNFYVSSGQRYSHTIDPATGRPVTHQLASVSVLASNCMTADALATALLVLGPEKGKELADEQGIAAYFLTRTESGFTSTISKLGQEQFHFLSLQELQALVRQEKEGTSVWLTIGLTVGMFALAILGLAAGVLISRRPLKGTCGGMSSAGGESPCMLCSKPREECDEFRRQMQAASEADGDETVS